MDGDAMRGDAVGGEADAVRRSRVGVAVAALGLALLGACGEPPDGRLVLEGVTLIDGTGAPPRPGTTIVIRDGRIEAVQPSAELERERGDSVLDGTGLWATPGLWDAHVHLTKAGAEALPVLVAMGVTSVRDMGGDLDAVRAMTRAVESGSTVGPRIYTSGPMLEAPATLERMAESATREPYQRTRIAIPDTTRARVVVDSLGGLGVDFIKIREYASEETYRAVVTAARRHGLDVAGHAPFSMAPEDGAALGVTSFEHASYPYPLDTLPEPRGRILDAFLRHDVAIVPTLVAWETSVMDPDSLRALVEDSAGRRDPRRRLVGAGLVEEWRVDVAEIGPRSPGYFGGYWGFLTRMSRDLKAMKDAGIPLVAGSDLAGVALFPGFALHGEIQRLVDWVGLSPVEAITSATAASAELVSAADSVGTVEPGKVADILLLSADPTRDIGNTRHVYAVVLRGELLGPDRIRELLRGVPTDARSGIGLVRGAPSPRFTAR